MKINLNNCQDVCDKTVHIKFLKNNEILKFSQYLDSTKNCIFFFEDKKIIFEYMNMRNIQVFKFRTIFIITCLT